MDPVKASDLPTLCLGATFKSFKEFDAAKRTYEDDVMMGVRFVIQSSLTATNENKKLLSSKRPQKLHDENLKYANVKYTCKFGGPRKESKSKGIRAVQEYVLSILM